ncbi:hypothetical protein RUND412_006092, partial [Rhizina undulata]
ESYLMLRSSFLIRFLHGQLERLRHGNRGNSKALEISLGHHTNFSAEFALR